MIKATDLRVGNLIHDPYDEVTDVDLNILFYLLKTEKDKQKNDRYKPIPLTEEWRLKLGIHETGNEFGEGNYSFNQYTKYDLYFGWMGEDNDGIVLVCEELDQLFGGVKAELKHVHQLQNLFHALTGEELKLTK